MTFTHILNLSIRATWLALAVMAVRLVLKKAPRAIVCCLWALVAIRLLCPISIESSLSLLPSREMIPQDYLIAEPKDPAISAPATLDIVNNPLYDRELSVELSPTVERLQTWDLISTVIWLTGMAAMGICALFRYLSLRLRVRMAAWVSGRIWECDDLDTPFILGILGPRIYLPSALDTETRRHVLAHEEAHLSRLDHIWKPLGFALLAVHWFNPILWLSYALLCRDMELACDERVVRNLDKPQILAYSGALLRCAVPHRAGALCPLAFGEVGVKSRIKAILHYKKSGFWMILIALILVLTLAVGFLTDPAAPKPEASLTPPTDIGTDDTLPLQSIQLTAAEIYQADDLPAFTAPEFQLNPDGTFRLVPNALTSYHAFGTYSLENGRLEMRTVDSRYVYVFYLDRDGQDFLYNRAESSEIQYYIDARTASLLPDGTRFTLAGLQETEPDTVMEGQVAELLNAIRYAPVHTFDPYDYIAANQEAYNQLICLGNETISYCFAQFEQGGQTGLKGSIMAIACRQILGLTDEFPIDTYRNNGQDWYDAYIRSAEAQALKTQLAELQEAYQSQKPQ